MRGSSRQNIRENVHKYYGKFALSIGTVYGDIRTSHMRTSEANDMDDLLKPLLQKSLIKSII